MPHPHPYRAGPDPREGKERSLPACRLCIPTCKKENILLALLLTADIVHSDVNMTACLFDIQIKKAVYKPVAIFLSAKDVKCDFRLKGSNPDCVCSFLLIYFVINIMWTVLWLPSCYTILKITSRKISHYRDLRNTLFSLTRKLMMQKRKF